MGLLKATKDLGKYPQCCEIGTISKAFSNLIALAISPIHCTNSVICFHDPCNLLTQTVTFFFFKEEKNSCFSLENTSVEELGSNKSLDWLEGKIRIYPICLLLFSVHL